MTRDNSLGVPLPPDPVNKDFGLTTRFEYGEIKEFELEDDDSKITIAVMGRENAPRATARTKSEEYSASEVLWTAVYFLREYGAPNEMILRSANGQDYYPSFALGGLYRYAGFALNDEEVNNEGKRENLYTAR